MAVPDRSRIGPYKLVEIIGEGGMGEVWLAEQTEPVKRMVALKIIKLGMDTRQVVARFEAERQALAVMDHPHIAKIYDGGATPEGRPYFVMELVRGQPITDYCDTERLSTPERVRLFVDACRAVQHAHLKGVVHRDLKPSNLLVSIQDGEPVVKVIDFGIAKAMGQSLTDLTLHTKIDEVIGTPDYMSPEQADPSSPDVDARTDIYSLGVVLYELLIGTRPYSLRDVKGWALGTALREKDALRPSALLTKSGTQETVAKYRSTTVRNLRRQLEGDLDWIVLKAMAKDRTGRYETTNSFALDLERHLEGEQVLARPPSTGYSLRKFVRRNRATVVGSAAVLTALVVGSVAGPYLQRIMSEEQQLLALMSEARSSEDPSAFYEAIDSLVTQVLGRERPSDPPMTSRTSEAMPMEAMRLLSLAVREREAGEIDAAIQYLTLAIDRYPNISAFTDLRAGIPGLLQVRIAPVAYVWLDGDSLGYMNRLELNMTPAIRHVLRFQRESFVTVDTTVMLLPGETRQLSIRLNPRRP